MSEDFITDISSSPEKIMPKEPEKMEESVEKEAPQKEMEVIKEVHNVDISI